jgi:hypothetical protein
LPHPIKEMVSKIQATAISIKCEWNVW